MDILLFLFETVNSNYNMISKKFEFELKIFTYSLSKFILIKNFIVILDYVFNYIVFKNDLVILNTYNFK